MALSTLSGFVIFVAVLSLCRPISAAWTGEGHCASPNIIVQLAYFISVTAIITDFTCAIVPSVILYKLHMNARLKWTVAAILSLGFLLVSVLTFDNFASANFLTTVQVQRPLFVGNTSTTTLAKSTTSVSATQRTNITPNIC